MKAILIKNVPKLGFAGDIVAVANGYFNNFLLPNGFATMATEEALKVNELRKGKLIMEKEQLLANAKEVIEKISGLKVTMKVKVSEKGHLYAAITEKDLIPVIEKAAKVRLEPEHISMTHVKEVGTFEVKVEMGENLHAKISLEVVSE